MLVDAVIYAVLPSSAQPRFAATSGSLIWPSTLPSGVMMRMPPGPVATSGVSTSPQSWAPGHSFTCSGGVRNSSAIVAPVGFAATGRCAITTVSGTSYQIPSTLSWSGQPGGNWAAGTTSVNNANLRVTVVDPRWVLPVPEALVRMAARHGLVVSVEDGGRHGGFGWSLAAALRDAEIAVPFRDLGIPQRFLAHSSREEVLADLGLTAQDIARAVTGWAAGLIRSAGDPTAVETPGAPG